MTPKETLDNAANALQNATEGRMNMFEMRQSMYALRVLVKQQRELREVPVPALTAYNLRNDSRSKRMTGNEFQQRIEEERRQGSFCEPLAYNMIALGGEAGEVLNAYKKSMRPGETLDGRKPEIFDELANVMFYVARVATIMGFSLDDIFTRQIDLSISLRDVDAKRIAQRARITDILTRYEEAIQNAISEGGEDHDAALESKRGEVLGLLSSLKG